MCLASLYCVLFSLVLCVKDNLLLGWNVLSNCSSISVFTASVLVIIGHVSER
jgi:hypothetical protein